jgi:hypothetical protein
VKSRVNGSRSFDCAGWLRSGCPSFYASINLKMF